MQRRDMRLRMELFVKNLQNAVDFYSRVLGFEKVHQSEQKAAVRNGAVLLELGVEANLSRHYIFNPDALPARKGLGIEIVLEVDDVNDYYKRVIEQNYPVETPLQRHAHGCTDFRIADLDGYFLRITSPA